jgi:hypothetical protein
LWLRFLLPLGVPQGAWPIPSRESLPARLGDESIGAFNVPMKDVLPSLNLKAAG